MSLEDKIGELTAAVNALAAVLAYSAAPATLTGAKAFVPDVTHNPVQAKAEVAPPKPKATPEITPAAATPVALAGPSVAEPAPSLTIDYAQVAKAITDTFKVDRAKTIEALAKFGAAKGPQLKPEQYAAFLKELTA